MMILRACKGMILRQMIFHNDCKSEAKTRMKNTLKLLYPLPCLMGFNLLWYLSESVHELLNLIYRQKIWDKFHT